MIKKKRIILLFLLLLIIIFIVLISFIFTIPAIGLGLLVLYLIYIWHAFTFKKIIINDDSLTFDAIVRKQTYSFEVFKNAALFIMRGAVISINKRRFSVYVNPNTKNGLIKIISLTTEINNIEKTILINKINSGIELF